ncbi:MAG TPA: DUF4331 domain-containing protein [Candidatus Saccharimonadales bacterium]|nr:DUF4331 domain-containing protein [Candidatus Saccharimonadales bacterium]
MSRTSRIVAIAGSAVLLAATVAPVFGASHREAPIIAGDAAADHTDVFAWIAPNTPSKVTFAVNVSPMQDPAGGPNFWQFDPKVRYEIKIDNDRDARADITYRFKFTTTIRNKGTFLYNTGQVTSPRDPDLNVVQTYSVTRITEDGASRVLGTDLPVAPANVGPRSNPDYEAKTGMSTDRALEPGYRTFAGQRDDPFFVDLGSIFDLGGLRPFNEAHVIPLATADGVDALKGNNVLTIAFQAPIKELTKGRAIYKADDPKATIGIWAANYRQANNTIKADGSRTASGSWIQVSRMANPLINEVIIPIGLKDRWNASKPWNDSAFEKYYLKPELAGLINVLYPPTADIKETGRTDLSLILLQGIPGVNNTGAVRADLLRLNTGIAPCTSDPAGDDAGNCRRLGAFYDDKIDLAAWPNGRRPSDDVTDIAIRAVAEGYGAQLNAAFGLPNKTPNNLLGDGVDKNDRPFFTWFPYLGAPSSGYTHTHHEAK